MTTRITASAKLAPLTLLLAVGCGGQEAPAARTAPALPASVTIAPGDNTLVSGLGGDDGFGEIALLPAATVGGDSDDDFWVIDLSTIFPHGIDFFGTKYDAATEVFAGTNSYITFGQGSWAYNPQGIASSRLPIVAAFYGDAEIEGTAKVYLDLDTSDADPVATLTYYQVRACCSAAPVEETNSYQIRLHRVASDEVNGDKVGIELRYAQIGWSDGDEQGGWADGKATGGEDELFGDVPTSVFGEIAYSGTESVNLNATTDEAVTNLVPPVYGVYFWQPVLAELHAGTPQTAVVGTAFAHALEVRLTDTTGAPLANATVAFVVPEEGASAVLSAATATTDANGIATVTATANEVIGEYTVEAFASGGSFSSGVSFALSNIAVPPTIEVVSGSGQTARVGKPYALPLTVLVKDPEGAPAAGVTVTFTVGLAPAAAGGEATVTLSALTATTDENGHASVTATAGTVKGAVVVQATAPGVLTPATFSLVNKAKPSSDSGCSTGGGVELGLSTLLLAVLPGLRRRRRAGR